MSTVSSCQRPLFSAPPIIDAPKTPGKHCGNSVKTVADHGFWAVSVGFSLIEAAFTGWKGESHADKRVLSVKSEIGLQTACYRLSNLAAERLVFTFSPDSLFKDRSKDIDASQNNAFDSPADFGNTYASPVMHGNLFTAQAML